MKTKYETRLKELKKEFEVKFKKNDATWRNRLEFHKQAFAKEQQKTSEYEKLLQEMNARIVAVEKKNKALHQLLVSSNKQGQHLQQ